MHSFDKGTFQLSNKVFRNYQASIQLEISTIFAAILIFLRNYYRVAPFIGARLQPYYFSAPLEEHQNFKCLTFLIFLEIIFNSKLKTEKIITLRLFVLELC